MRSALRAAVSAVPSLCGAVSKMSNLGANLFRLLEDFRKSGRRHGHHRRRFGHAGVLPLRGRGLRVEVEHQRIAARRGKGRGEMKRERRFADAALLVDERNRLRSSSPLSPSNHLQGSLFICNLIC
jgi:hypothetical protein